MLTLGGLPFEALLTLLTYARLPPFGALLTLLTYAGWPPLWGLTYLTYLRLRVIALNLDPNFGRMGTTTIVKRTERGPIFYAGWPPFLTPYLPYLLTLENCPIFYPSQFATCNDQLTFLNLCSSYLLTPADCFGCRLLSTNDHLNCSKPRHKFSAEVGRGLHRIPLQNVGPVKGHHSVQSTIHK